MAELNNAIKSIVEATESDPVFEKFLDEIIGPHTETDTSPEEDGEGKLSPKSVNECVYILFFGLFYYKLNVLYFKNIVFRAQEKQMEAGTSNVSSPEPGVIDSKVSAEDGIADVPLKHRLRSSSRQQYNRIEDEVDKARDQEKDQNALEDQNAAAILSIINANIINNVSDSDKKTFDTKELITINDDDEQKMQTMVSLTATNVQKTSNVTSANNNVQSKVKKSTVKRPRPTKPKRDQTISDNQSSLVQSNTIQPITEHEIMTMPTLIVCSKDEVNNFLINRSSTITSTSTSRFIPIAPKDSNRIKETVETLFLRTVNVAQKLPLAKTLPSVEEEPNDLVNQVGLQSTKKNSNVNKRLKAMHKTDTTVPIIDIDQQILNSPVELVQTDKIVGGESITLYGSEISAKTSLDSTNMPMINLEENISLSESGLSPYLKFNCSKTNQSHNLSDIDLAPVMESAMNATTNNNKNAQSPKNVDVITKRTPKSLLKSRSKNHRLSLSTPRKRSSHIRALDFSTPTRTSSTKKTSGDGNVQSAKRLKSVCRTSLFRSPSLANTSAQKSPMKVGHSYRIPIATRSPAPKLMGGWDKCNGVGVIIGEISPHASTSASCSSSEDRIVLRKPSKPPVGSWDADLRKSIESNKRDEKEPETSKKRLKRRKSPIKDKSVVISKKVKYSPRSTRSNNERKSKPKMKRKFKPNAEDSEPEKNSRENVTEPQNNEKEILTKTTVNTACSIEKFAEISESTSTREAPAKMNITDAPSSSAIATEKKPVRKYVPLKTISTNLRKSDNEKEKNTEINSQVSEVSRILSADSTQHILRMPDMMNLETPRKFDNISGPPPTPRVLSPSSNLITPFIKISEDSSKIRSFIATPEFPITPGVALTPKEETTRDIIKIGEYNSPYYKPTSEQIQDSDLKVSMPKANSTQESPIISSSHIKLHSTHNSLASGNTYQTCTSKLEITEFEVIKENLPREEAIKEFKIASTSKDSVSAAELNASIVIDHHVDLIQINEFKGVSETIIDASYANDSHNESAESSSSSSDTSSSSSSSSSSTSSSSNTNASTNTCSPNAKCDKASSKTSTDISSDFAEKSINAPKDTHDVPAAASGDACKKSDRAIETESSPKKVFAIAKTDDQLESTMKETPAKDETVLNEADISETPSSSKSGVETINLTTKISAIITEDEKLSRSSKSSSKIQINKSRAQPKIIDIQCIRPGSSKFIESLKPTKDERQSEQSAPVHDKFMHRQLLEEKRQRIMAKIKDNSKLTLPTGTKRKRILTGKAADTLKKFGRGNRNLRPTAKYSRDVNKNTESQDNRQETSRKNTRRKCEPQKQKLLNKCCDNEEETTNRIGTSTSADSGLTNKPLDDHTKKQLGENNICENNIVKHCKKSESTQLYNSLSEDQDYLKETSDSKENIEKNYNIKSNVDKKETEEAFKSNNVQGMILKKDTNSEKQIVVQEALVPDKKHDQTEDKVNKLRQFSNNVDKSDYKILRYKVDQVKRDLFSDEENDYKTSSTINAEDNKTKKIADADIENPDEVPGRKKNADIENPKQELSTVLQCLQLVPASKKEQLDNSKNQTEKKYKEQSEHESESDNESRQTADVHNYKAEYHFVYDDSIPMRKRRRRYSGHELQIQINYADLSDPNPVECIKVMKATEFEEIFNLPPKKRTVNKKSRMKNEKVPEISNFQTDKSTFNLKDETAKPLATSSPVDETLKTKTKKIIKTTATNKTNNNTQSDVKKKQKLDKHQEKGKIVYDCFV